MTKAVTITGQVMANDVYKEKVLNMVGRIEEGKNVVDTMREAEVMPDILTDMVGVGEETGEMKRTLDIVAEYYDHELEQAVAKATGLAAKHYRLEKRGVLEVGCYADINVFNIHELKINATFNDPCRYCEGMDYVLVNGQPVVEKGQLTNKRVGRVLRHLPKE